MCDVIADGRTIVGVTLCIETDKVTNNSDDSCWVRPRVRISSPNDYSWSSLSRHALPVIWLAFCRNRRWLQALSWTHRGGRRSNVVAIHRLVCGPHTTCMKVGCNCTERKNSRCADPSDDQLLFHRRTRASYVYNGRLAWYNVVLTPRIHSSVKFAGLPLHGDSCDGGISVLYNCLS